MRWLLLFFVLFIGSMACNKGADPDRKFRLMKMYYKGDPFPTIFEYDEQGSLSHRYVDFKDMTDAGSGTQFKYENGRLSQIINSRVSIAGLTQTVDKIEYDIDGRLKSIKEELKEGRPEILSRYEFGYTGNSMYFDSCIVHQTKQGTETPYLLYTFTRDDEGNILTQSTWSPDQGNWLANHTDEFSYGTVDNPEYKLGTPVSFTKYYSKKICTKLTRYNFDGNVLDQESFKVFKISPMLIRVRNEKGEELWYDLK